MEVDPKLFTSLINTLKSLAERLPVGVPTPADTTNLVLGSRDVKEVRKAIIWGSTIQTGKFFPNDKNFGFLKPLFSGLTAMFTSIFIDKLPGKLSSILGNFVTGNKISEIKEYISYQNI